MTEHVDRIPTTHAGSLPRPDDLVDMIWARADGEQVDPDMLSARIDDAVDDIVRRQREVGIDLVSDGEMPKSGFSSYVSDRFSGFGGRSEFQADDVAEFPKLAMQLFATPAFAHMVSRTCVDKVELTDRAAVHKDIGRLRHALGNADPASAFIGAVSPGQIAFNYPNHYYDSHEKYLAALGEAMSYEYQAITEAGFTLQVDSPDLAMSAHCRSVGSDVGSWQEHLPLAVDALNRALDGIPREKVRLHVCWGNYGGPHHMDVPLRAIVDEVLRSKVGAIYVEGANPRHEHEWRVFEDVQLPDEMSVILGVIDTKANLVEHPRVVADRLVRLARIVGRERVIAGTDCGFDTFIRFSPVDPEVAWLKLGALAAGAELASSELW
jgi:5-methyltetrahydropteroyltriglutamate--homocysteine methyltransferase